MEYVTAPERGGQGHENPFLHLPGMNDDKAALILYRGDHNYLVLNKFPYNPGHILVVPFREVAELENLADEERNEHMALIVKAKCILKEALHPDGFNIGFNFGSAAGAGIPTHLHAHVVPRWNGDTNFMPVVGQTRVLPQALSATWEHLRAYC